MIIALPQNGAPDVFVNASQVCHIWVYEEKGCTLKMANGESIGVPLAAAKVAQKLNGGDSARL